MLDPQKLEKADVSLESITTPSHSDASTQEKESPPPAYTDGIPDGGYGWVCVAACFSINMFTWGIVASYGVYLAHYLSTPSLFPSSHPRDYALIGGLNFSTAMLVAPTITSLARRFGPQVPMLIGVFFLSSGFLLASFAGRIWHLYLTQGVLVGVGVGFVYVPSVAILSQWFSRRRSLANGISAAGSGVGGLVFALSTGRMIETLGVSWALRITAGVVFIMNLLAALIIRDRNLVLKPTQRGFDTALLRRYDVILLLAWGCVSMLGYITILFSLSDFALSIGCSRGESSVVTALLNLGTALGRPWIGVVSDRYGRIETAGVLTLVCAVSVFAVWIPAANFLCTAVFAVINGAILGVFWVSIGPLCAEVAGMEQLPSLLSLSWLSVVLPTAFSEVVAVKLRTQKPGAEYLYPQIFAGLSYMVASGIMYELRRVKRKQHRENN
ncbi:major facilitator superfamily protein [Wilcoxina mikolae CBS 423.85]|nr:major facilitator superfamily protein [Wilcoxina mikolae CBS 423.85]